MLIVPESLLSVLSVFVPIISFSFLFFLLSSFRRCPGGFRNPSPSSCCVLVSPLSLLVGGLLCCCWVTPCSAMPTSCCMVVSPLSLLVGGLLCCCWVAPCGALPTSCCMVVSPLSLLGRWPSLLLLGYPLWCPAYFLLYGGVTLITLGSVAFFAAAGLPPVVPCLLPAVWWCHPYHSWVGGLLCCCWVTPCGALPTSCCMVVSPLSLLGRWPSLLLLGYPLWCPAYFLLYGGVTLITLGSVAFFDAAGLPPVVPCLLPAVWWCHPYHSWSVAFFAAAGLLPVVPCLR